MSHTTVWAYKPLEELEWSTGLVVCENKLAAKLIKSGDVQDPRVGGLHLKEIEYDTKVMTPKKKAAPKKKKATKKKVSKKKG
jgi:hypothetical protein